MTNSPDDKFIADAVNKWSDTVFRVAFQYTRDRLDAEDILQDVFLQLIKTPPATENEGDIKAWLIRVTINKGKDFYRASKRRRAFGQNYSPHPQANDNSEVFEALGRLKENDRNAVYLHYYEGYTAREIAAIIGGNERAVTKRIERARTKLKNFLEE